MKLAVYTWLSLQELVQFGGLIVFIKKSPFLDLSDFSVYGDGFGLAAAAAGVRAGYQTVLPAHYGLSPGYVYGTPSYMQTVGGVGAGVGTGAGGLVQLPQLQHAAAMAAANHLYEYQAAAAQGAAAYQQQYAAAGFDPYATAAAAAAAAASGAGYMSQYYALPGGGVQGPLLPPLAYPPQLQEARMQ
nr:fibroin heavy chain-like [Maniola hyperantus]